MTETRRKRWTNEELAAQLEKDKTESKAAIFDLITHNKLLDDDGYPTKAALDVIRIWHWTDSKGWFKFIQSLWAMKHFGWDEGETPHEWDIAKLTYQYHLSTAGWSGNESIIRAMEENEMLWFQTWVQSRRGGHYIFEDRDYGDEE